ncbi:MAG: hypothetical protein CL608_17470 [Anaerolineaceae bacterium]|nr:hypothetical protein [Anaerolineaceae bacterium]
MKVHLRILVIPLFLLAMIMIIQHVLRPVYAAGPWYVAPGGADGNDCLSPAAPCATINGALNKPGFVPGDTINVAVGIYTGTGDEVILLNKDATLAGGWNASFSAQNGYSTIDGEASRPGIMVNNGVTAVVGRFVVQNGSSWGGAGVCNLGTLTLINMTISDNNANTSASVSNSNDCNTSLNGGGIYNTNTGVLTLNDSEVSGNSVDCLGSAVYNEGEFTSGNSIFSENTAGGAACIGVAVVNKSAMTLTNTTIRDNVIGGGIYNNGASASLIINNGAISGNDVGDEWTSGGITNWGGSVTLNNSAVNDNWGSASGGIHNGNDGTLIINNSTVSNNIISPFNSCLPSGIDACNGGGISNNSGTVILSSSTVSHNKTPDEECFEASVCTGGGIYNYSGVITLQNSILADNTASGGSPDCGGTIGSAGYNLIGDSSGCSFTSATGDLLNINPKLGPLFGTPGYHFLLSGSPAIDGGNPAGCTDNLDNLLNTDQRGVPRVGRCDIGSYEFDPNNDVTQVFLPVTFRDFCADFFDNFGNPASGWSVGENAQVRFEYLNGEYRVLSKEAGFIYFFRAPTCSRENYIVETDARWVGTPGGSYGLIFGISDSLDEFFNQYYLFDINTDFQSFRLLRRNSDGSFTAVAPPTTSSAINSGNAANHLKVMRNGDQITLEVNGTVLGSWIDGVITGLTDVGLIASPYSNIPTSDARFDNFAVNNLSGSATFQSRPQEPHIETNNETVTCTPVSWIGVPDANVSGHCAPGWVNDGSH